MPPEHSKRNEEEAPDFANPPVSERDIREAEAALRSKPGNGARPFMTSFMEHLVRTGTITHEIAVKAAEWKRKNDRDRRSMLELLKEEFGVSGEAVNTQVAQFYAFRTIDPGERVTRRLSYAELQKLVKSLPEQARQLAMRYKVVPFDVAENQPDKIIVVTPNPADREIMEVIRAFPYKKFEICYMQERAWVEFWHQVGSDKGQPNSVPVELPREEETGDLEATLEREINRAQLLAMVDNVMNDAVRVSASDIHFVPRGMRKTDILFRIDGHLTTWYSIDDARSDAVITAIKSRCVNVDRFERMTAQEGVIHKMPENVRFTVSVLPVATSDPSVRRETVVLHTAHDGTGERELDQLGISSTGQGLIKDALSVKAGLILVAGPARSGRTTTLHAMLKSVVRPTVNVIAVEEPLQMILDGVRQVRLNPKLSFEDALEGVLKHDPDVVLLGELRTREAMEFALRLAASECLVLAAIRAYDAVAALQRIYQSGVEPFLLGQMVRLVHAQRLVRCLCERCREKETDDRKRQLAKLGFPENVGFALYKPVGCGECVGGFHGRTAIAETLVCTQEIRDIIAGNAQWLPVQALRERAALQGMEPLLVSARALLEKGVATAEDLVSVVS